MKLVKTSFFASIITITRISSGFVAGKFIAIFTGPAGVALVGAFFNFITIALTLANGAINSGVIKYTSEYHNSPFKLKELFSTALKISFYSSLIIGLIIIGFAPSITNWLFSSTDYINPVRILGATILLYSLNTLLTSILNGKGDIKSLTLVSAIGNVITLVVTIALVYFYKLQGALYALAIGQSIVFFVTFLFISKQPWFSWSYFKQPFNKLIALKLGHFTLMALVSALTVPVSQILLRNMLIDKIGVDSAGYWQGMMRVSDGYLMLITTSLGTYYLPKLSRLKLDKEIRAEVFNGYKIILPIVLLGCISIYVLRFFIIKILFTPDFFNMEVLFLWQLVGDFFKMAAYILAYLMLAKSMTKMYIFTEILFNLSYVLLGYLFVNIYGLKGISIAFGVNYFLYMVIMIFLFKKLIFNYK